MRDEHLQKQSNLSRIKIKELGHSVDEQIESVFIDKTVDFGEDDDTDYQSLS